MEKVAPYSSASTASWSIIRLSNSGSERDSSHEDGHRVKGLSRNLPTQCPSFAFEATERYVITLNSK